MNITCNHVSLSKPQSNELESKCSLIHDKWVCHNFFETLLDTIVLDQSIHQHSFLCHMQTLFKMAAKLTVYEIENVTPNENNGKCS